MSTENTQTDASPSDMGAEHANVNMGMEAADTPAVSEDTPKAQSLDNLKELAKDPGKFEAKPVEDALNPAEEAKAYAADYKYKAALQEKEIEEFWRPLIKDADSEKRVKDALTKLDGFDSVKESRESVLQQYESLHGDYQEQAQVINRVESAIQRKDLSSVFRQLNLTEQDIFNWTHKQLQVMELPPEQREAMLEAEQHRNKNFEMEEQMGKFQSMYEEQAVQARTMQLDHTLSRPEIQSAAHNWDSSMGQPGSFRDLVIQEAQTAYYQEEVDLSAEQAVQRVMQKFGKVLSQNPQGQQAAPQAQSPMQVNPQVPEAKPVIPSASGRGTTPIKKVPKSLDDLKKLAKEYNR